MKLDLTDKMYNNVTRILMGGWVLFSALSLLIIKLQFLTDWFVIISILSRLLIGGMVIRFYLQLFKEKKRDKSLYTFLKSFTGYGITLTYVFFSLPLIVENFYSPGELILFRSLLILLTTLFPALLYLLLASKKGKSALGFYTKKEIVAEIKIKKDKVKRKDFHKKLKSERNFFQNLWFEWVDPLLFAIIVVLLVQNFVFQMFEIPSESMVPTFYKKDRVVVSHFDFGPYLPLTNIRLPAVSKPKTGDIITFVNPAVDDPRSGLGYNNVFTGVFQPFFYMLTFSLVDIDAKPNGDPKERLLVKRVLAVEGEKICIVNDDVYKKTPDSDWALMERGSKDGNFGNESLFWDENPQMDVERVSRTIRTLLDEAAYLVNKTDVEVLQSDLIAAAADFINISTTIDVESYKNRIDKFLNNNTAAADQISRQTYDFLRNVSYLNQMDYTPGEKKQIMENLENTVSVYRFVTYFNTILEMNTLPSEDDIITDITIDADSNPFDRFMKTLNSLYKLNRLKLYSAVLSTNSEISFDALTENEELSQILERIYLLDIYINGFRSSVSAANISRMSYFDAGNLPEYPAGSDNYINDNEYFMSGDNRYNSLDSRFSRYGTTEFYLDSDDKTTFGAVVPVTWDPYAVAWKYIRGKMRTIVFPFTRFRLF